MLSFYNTKTRSQEAFVPYNKDHISIYCCGPTVYDNIHIGNARPLVVFDVLYRFLKRCYPRVTYVRNITDVDDKINARAFERGISIQTLTEETIKRFHQDVAALGCLTPDHEPRATEHIAEIIDLVQKIIDNGHAYVSEGHVLFDVHSYAAYGDFAGKELEDQVLGARVDVASYKRNGADFVLWKPSSDKEPGWDSPWGYGRPGWHIECSAMSVKYLGQDFDIHAGGIDLVFPHHQNEIAQCVCGYKGARFANYWMHNGYLLLEGKKMSKSLGNFYTIADLLKEFDGEVLRLVLLQTHYRHPLDFTVQKCKEAEVTLDRLYRALQKVEAFEVDATLQDDDAVMQALGDDLNTVKALAHLHDMAGRIQKETDAQALKSLKSAFVSGLHVLGLGAKEADAWLKRGACLDADAIDVLIKERNQAKKSKDFAKADAIRQALQDKGIQLEDTPTGTVWRSL